MQWLMLQQDAPQDYVIATGEQYSVRDFVDAAAHELGIAVRWEGEGVDERALTKKVVNVLFRLTRDIFVLQKWKRYLVIQVRQRMSWAGLLKSVFSSLFPKWLLKT